MFRAARTVSAVLVAGVVLTACGGGGHSTLGGLVQSGNSGGSSGGGSSTAHGNGNVAFTIKIPPRAPASSRLRSPATISAVTNSVSITVNGASPAQTFNVSAATCNTGCTLNVGAPYGLDSFLVETFAGQNATGAALNAAATSLNVTPAGPNQATATAGTILTVTSPADGGGSCGITGAASGCTLREAVTEAAADASNNSGNSSYTDAIMFAPGISNIALSSGTITINSNVVLIGPGASAPPNPLGIGAPAAASKLTINGGGNQIFYNGSYTFGVAGLTLTGGSSSDGYGGAIENYGTLSISNSAFTGNTAGTTDYTYGGAIYDEGSGTTTIVASTFTNNSAVEGGAYYDEDGASFSADAFNGNTAFDLSSYGEGGAIYADFDLSVDRSIFTNNVAGSSSASGISAYGGAISIEDNSMSPSITNSTFGGSSSSGNFAGGLGSSDDGEGGAIYNDGSNPLTLSGDTFAYNTARGGSDAYGGAISDYLGITSMNDTFTNNTADSSLGTSGYAYGGAVYSSYSGSTFSATQDTFSANVANGSSECDGGGLYVSASLTDLVMLSSAQFTDNTCTATTGTPSPYAYGGGLKVDSAQISFEDLTFSGNAATSGNSTYAGNTYGGGFEYYEGFEGESVARKGSAQATHRSSPKANQPARSAVDFARSQAVKARHMARKSKHAAAALAAHRAPGTIRSMAIRKAKVISGPVDGMDTVTFTGNTANGGPSGYAYGGGADLTGNITVTNTTFSGNTATASGSGAAAYGGGLSYAENGCGTMAFTGTVSNNSALTQGGGLWNDCTVNITGSSISGNKVTAVANVADGGGGIYNYSVLTLSQSTVNGNTVSGNLAGTGGGGIFNDYQLTIANSTIASNTSAADGGGLYDDSTGTIVNATFYGNSAASGNGGNVFNNSTDTLQNSILANGTASSGPDYYMPVPTASTPPFTDNGYNYYQTTPVNVPAAVLNPTSLQSRTPALTQTTVSVGGISMLMFAETSASTTRGAIPYDATNGCAGTLFPGITTDQRGRTRGVTTAGFCDIGAYEYP